MGARPCRLWAAAVEKNPYKAEQQGNAKGNLLAASTDRNVPKVQKAGACRTRLRRA